MTEPPPKRPRAPRKPPAKPAGYAASLAGKFLVAMPGIADPRFERAVILLCAHDAEQAMGIVVNRQRAGIDLGDVLSQLGIRAKPAIAPRSVLEGGPVAIDRGFLLHTADYDAEDATRPVAPGIGLTTAREALEVINSPARPVDFTLALGYAGWGPGQLEGELAQNVWLVAEPSQDIVFGRKHDGKWAAAIKSLGFDPGQITPDGGMA
jgi:putative transcriptional regulator